MGLWDFQSYSPINVGLTGGLMTLPLLRGIFGVSALGICGCGSIGATLSWILGVSVFSVHSFISLIM